MNRNILRAFTDAPALKGFNMTLEEMIAKRGKLIIDARAKLDEIKSCTTETRMTKLEGEHDAILAEFDKIDAMISRELPLHNAEREDALVRARVNMGEDERQREKRRPGMSVGTAYGTDDGSQYRGSSDIWVDSDGKEVRCLTARDRVATDEWRGPRLGSILRAMVTGPRNDDERRALGEGTDSAGGFTVPTPLAAEFIDKMRQQSVLMRAGARTIPMPSETLGIARLETDPVAYWKAENAAMTESDPTFGRVELTARTLRGMVKMSRELADDSINVATMLERAMTQAVALEFDRAGLYGSGTAPEPRGIANTSGINTVEMGDNGAALASYDKIIDSIYSLQLANSGDPTGMIWHPRTGASLAKLKDGDGNPLSLPDLVANVPKLQTTAMPIDEDQGTAEGVASSIIMGDFTQLLAGIRTNIRIELLNERYADNHQVAFVFWMRGDFQLAQKLAFTRLAGILV